MHAIGYNPIAKKIIRLAKKFNYCFTGKSDITITRVVNFEEHRLPTRFNSDFY